MKAHLAQEKPQQEASVPQSLGARVQRWYKCSEGEEPGAAEGSAGPGFAQNTCRAPSLWTS